MTEFRLLQSLQHLTGMSSSPATSKLLERHPDDVVVVACSRTPFCRSFSGGFKDTPLETMLWRLIENTIKKIPKIEHNLDDICLGNVLNANAIYCLRAAALKAGVPESVPCQTVNRLCSSGLMAISAIANRIKAGEIDSGMALGAEAISADMQVNKPLDPRIMEHERAAQVPGTMGWTSEEVGRQFGLSKADLDDWGAISQQRASHAKNSGLFDDEIDYVENFEGQLLKHDGGIRENTKAENLAKLRPAFAEFGNLSTAGNSSQVTDGAAAIVLMRRSKAEALNLKPLAKFVEMQTVALEPRIMGIGPSLAIPKLLTKLQLNIEDIDIFEINEAFATMIVYCRYKLNIPKEKLNLRGGAIAIGHPFGATGVRLPVTLISQMKQTGKKLGITSMCIGTGMVCVF